MLMSTSAPASQRRFFSVPGCQGTPKQKYQCGLTRDKVQAPTGTPWQHPPGLDAVCSCQNLGSAPRATSQHDRASRTETVPPQSDEWSNTLCRDTCRSGLSHVTVALQSSFLWEAGEPKMDFSRIYHTDFGKTRRIVSEGPEGTVLLNGLLLSHRPRHPCQNAYSTMLRDRSTMATLIQIKRQAHIFEPSMDSLFWQSRF